MRLHAVVGSPNSRKVLAVVNHLGIDVEVEYHDFFAGDLRTSDYLALNPNGMVPTLTDGTFTLWESNAIMQFLADKSGGDDIFPRDLRRRAEIVCWQCWELSHFNRAFGTLAWETVAKPNFNLGSTNAALVEAAQANLVRFASVLEGHLDGRQCVVGDAVTIADYSVIHLEGTKDAIPFDWSPYPRVNAYFDRMRDVEHWARTAPASAADVGRKPQAA